MKKKDSKRFDRYLAIDGANNEQEIFENIEDAREWLKESFLDEVEGYHYDMSNFQIYKLYEGVDVEETKDGFTHKFYKI
jgi:hypothetical protein